MSAAAYNLGCVRALTGDIDGSKQWLKLSVDLGKAPPALQFDTDPDLKAVRQTEWFRDLLLRLLQ